MQVINLISGPSTGKSATAAGLFYYMKNLGMSVEAINEYAKVKTWEKHFEMLKDQLYITAKQNRKLEPLRGQVDYVITDSCLLLGMIYAGKSYYQNYAPFLLEVFNSYDNKLFFMERNLDREFEDFGRSQTLAECIEKDQEILEMLAKYNIPYVTIKDSLTKIETIIRHLN